MDFYKDEEEDVIEERIDNKTQCFSEIQDIPEDLQNYFQQLISSAMEFAKQEDFNSSIQQIKDLNDLLNSNPILLPFLQSNEIFSFLFFLCINIPNDELLQYPLSLIYKILDVDTKYFNHDLLNFLFDKITNCTMFLQIIIIIYHIFIILIKQSDEIRKDFIENDCFSLIDSQLPLFTNEEEIMDSMTVILQIFLEKEKNDFTEEQVQHIMNIYLLLLKIDNLNCVYALTEHLITNEILYKYLIEQNIIEQIFQSSSLLWSYYIESKDMFDNEIEESLPNELKDRKNIINNGLKILTWIIPKLENDYLINTFCFDEICSFIAECKNYSFVEKAILVLSEFSDKSPDTSNMVMQSEILSAFSSFFYDFPFKIQELFILLLLRTMRNISLPFNEVIVPEMWNLLFEFIDDDNEFLVSELGKTLSDLISKNYSLLNFLDFTDKIDEYANSNSFFDLFQLNLQKEEKCFFDDPDTDY